MANEISNFGKYLTEKDPQSGATRASAIGSTIEGVGNIGLGIASLSQNKKLHEEAMSLESQKREDVLAQQAISNKMRQQGINLAKTQQNIAFESQNLQSRMNRFFQTVNENKFKRDQAINGIQSLGFKAQQSSQFKDMLLNVKKGQA